jgi:hypothetical protein
MIVGAHQLGIPITIGSCGTCGVDEGVDFMEDICREILEEEGLSAKITKIYTEQTKEEMKAKLAEGKIRPPGTRVDVTEDILDSCSHIVAASGVEPFIKALKDGADIVLCGRATDTAVLACMPIIKGCSEAAAWHGAKVCECGALCSTNPQNGGIYDEFYVTMYGEQTRYIHFVGNCMGAKMCLVVQIFLLSGGKSVFSMSYYKVLEI